MKLPILAATILLATSSLALATASDEKGEYGAYQSTSPQADQPYKAQMPGDNHKAGAAPKKTGAPKYDDEKYGDKMGKDHKAGASHKAGYPPYVRFYHGYGHGYWRHGHFVPYHRHY